MSEKFDVIIRSVGNLPPMPVVATRVLALLNQEESLNYKELAAAISNDTAIAARLLKIANSSMYNMAREIKTLDRAISVVGEMTLRTFVLTASLEVMNRECGKLEKMLWEDSVGCAIGCRTIAQSIDMDINPEEAFLAGLFRHIGKLIMNLSSPKVYMSLTDSEDKKQADRRELEEAMFSFSHAVIGAAVLDKWKFSETLVSTTLYHADSTALQQVEQFRTDLLPLLCVVNLSDAICQNLGLGRPCRIDNLQWIIQSLEAKILHLTPDSIMELTENIESSFLINRSSFID